MSDIEALKKEVPPFQIFDLIPQYAAQGFIDPERIDLLKWAVCTRSARRRTAS